MNNTNLQQVNIYYSPQEQQMIRTWMKKCPISPNKEIPQESIGVARLALASCMASLPGFNCYVVTASQDCEEVHGCCDQAISYFITDDSSSIPAQCGHIIERWWRTQFYEGSQSCWQYLFEEGLMDSKQAVGIASRVWQEQAEDLNLGGI